MLVQQILKGKSSEGVVALKPGASVSEAAAMLSEKRIGTVVISADGNKADGILSERDIVRELGKRGPGCMSENVSDLMTKKLVTCAPEDSTDKVLGQMTEGRFRHMPVVDKGVLVGLISLGDVVKAQLSEISMEKEALQGMIMGH